MMMKTPTQDGVGERNPDLTTFRGVVEVASLVLVVVAGLALLLK